MKIGYVAFLDYAFLGVKNKIQQQIEAFQIYGIEVIPIIIKWSKSNEDLKLNENTYLIEPLSSANVIYKRLFAISKMREIIQQTDMDLLYIRYPIADPLLYIFIRSMTIPVITEHQTKELEEIKKTYARYFSEKYYGPKILKVVSGVVAVTKEIGLYEKQRANRQDMPICVIGNGISVKNLPLRVRKASEGELRLLFVGHAAKWHGLDRLIRGIKSYKGEIGVSLSIVGNGTEVKSLMELASEEGVNHKVLFYPTMGKKELDLIFDNYDIAIGTLGLHRVGLAEGSVLKVREYCARGIPFLYSAIDNDFPDKFRFKMNIQSDEMPISIEKVISFAKDALSVNNHSHIMRKYAEENLDWRVKTKTTSLFLRHILEGVCRSEND